MATLSLDFTTQLNIAYLIRYLILAAIVIFIQHYVTTFREERRYIWNAPPSFAKYSFIISRHIPIICAVLAFVSLSGFLGYKISDKACGWILCVTTLCISVSLMLNNVLATLYIVSLWDHNQTLLRVMFAAFTMAYTTAAVAIFVGLARMKAGMVWMPFLNSCIVTDVDSTMILTAAAPLCFELTMLAAVCWNAFDRPRSALVSLRHALADDGVVFFLCTTSFRTIQLALASTRQPGLAMLGQLSASLTCIVSVIFNQRAFAHQAAARAPRGRAQTTPSMLPLNRLLPRKPKNVSEKLQLENQPGPALKRCC